MESWITGVLMKSGGSWVGPVVAGAVILGVANGGRSERFQEVDESTARSAGSSQQQIQPKRWVLAGSEHELDEIGLSSVGCYAASPEQITIDFDEIIVDGNLNYFP